MVSASFSYESKLVVSNRPMVIQESSPLETSAWFKRFNMVQPSVFPDQATKTGGWATDPSEKWIEMSSSQLGWFSIPFPTVSGKSFKIPWFQSPPTSSPLHFPKIRPTRRPSRRVAIGPWRPTRGPPPRDKIPGEIVGSSRFLSHSISIKVMGCQ